MVNNCIMEGMVKIETKKILAAEMGKEIKVIRAALLKYITDSEYQTVTTNAELDYLSTALNNIDKYRSVTEDRCFNKGYIDSTNIFYGK